MNAIERAAKEIDQQTVLAWLDGQIAETERCIEARLQAASTWRGGAPEEWRSVGCTLTKTGRIEVAEKELRIAGKYRHDLECLRVLRKHFAEPAERTLTQKLDALYEAGGKAWERVPAEPAERADQWQPIATAPKDGTPVLLCEGPVVASGQFCHQEPWGVKRDGFYFDGASMPSNATHWQPLPSSPTKK